MDIKTSLGNNIINHYSNEGVVCPPQLRTGKLVVGAADNIDHNPSSTHINRLFSWNRYLPFPELCSDSTKPKGTTPVVLFQIEKQVKEIRALPSSFTESKAFACAHQYDSPLRASL
ncbi:hypothetical protein RRG08_035272 [Elysia crispata]|uniref:Uncharacterized protein n=1 Tax=Elysia crispata TaxID=231223 RepID=A0AAE0ZY07_9GAST|nr:hypothetical protein RRG08_035272 [Elysia crispata]